MLAFTVRLALTQFHRQQEIAQRKAARHELTASNQKVGPSLDDAPPQAAEIKQISALGSLLQGCASRAEVFQLIPECLRRLFPARDKHHPLAVPMLDLDHFKRYNDNLGHAAGDKALAAVGETLLRSVRAEDVACRYGREEFTIILPERSLRQATVRAEEIRQRVQDFYTAAGNQHANSLTTSMGVAAFDETTDRVDLLPKLADDALYPAKHAGRNRVVVAPPAAALPELNFTAAYPVPTAEQTGNDRCGQPSSRRRASPFLPLAIQF